MGDLFKILWYASRTILASNESYFYLPCRCFLSTLGRNLQNSGLKNKLNDSSPVYTPDGTYYYHKWHDN